MFKNNKTKKIIQTALAPLAVILLCLMVTVPLYPQVQNWRSIGYEFIQNQEYDKAISFFSLAMYASPQNGAIKAEYAYALQLARRYEEALAEYTVAIGLYDAPLADIKYNMALIHMQQGKYNKARLLFDEVLGLNPDDVGALLNRANSYLNLGQYAAALEDYQKYLEADPATSERQDIEQVLKILAQVADFPVNTVDKEKLQEKQALEEELNRLMKKLEGNQNTTLDQEPTNEYLLPLR